MAEANYDGFGAGTHESRAAAFGRMMNIAGAAATLTLLAGVAVWGYRLAVRDAHGVPVIQAMQGPMRIAPEEPGGRVAAHSGLSVNRIAAEGTAGEVPEQIVLAEPPVDLEPEDSAGTGGAAPVTAAAQGIPAIDSEDTMARTLALAEALALQAAADMAAEGGTGELSALDPPAAALPASAVQRSIRPMPRPSSRAAAAAGGGLAAITGTETVAASAPATTELRADGIAAGTRLAQIGAFDDADTARREWNRVAALHPALFEGKSLVIQPASSVGRTFYRLRVAGFDTEDDSRRFCRAVEAGDLRCIPVTTR